MICLNCEGEVTQEQARLFEGVFCCPSCYEVAASVLTRLERELTQLLTMARETIRVSLVTGKLHLSEGNREDLPKAELLKAMTRLMDQKRQNGPSSK